MPSKQIRAQSVRSRIRDLVAKKIKSQKVIAEEVGLDTGQLSRFMKRDDDQGISDDRLADLERVLDYLTPKDRVIPHSDIPELGSDLLDILAHKLHNDQLCLFVGAGISHLAPRRDGGPQRLPLWRGLADALEQEFFPADPDSFADPLDLFDAIAYEHKDGRDAGREVLVDALQKHLDDKPYVSSEAHEAFKTLPWHAVLTTNYDGLLMNLLGEEPITAEDEYYRRSEKSPSRLFQIHGTLSNPHTLTREDYRLWPDKHPQAWTHLQEILLTKTLLIVGYSLSDPHIDHVLALVRKMTQDKDRDKRLYAWMWRLNERQKDLLNNRDKITAISIERQEDWAQAFRVLAGKYETLREHQPTVPKADRRFDTHYNRKQYHQAMWAKLGPANVSAIYLPGAGYARDDILLRDIFVLPDLEEWQKKEPRYSDEIGSGVEVGGSAFRQSSITANPADETNTTEENDDVKLRMHLERELAKPTRREPADNWLKRHSQLLIVGDAGQGKTTLLQHWFLEALDRWQDDPHNNPLPVFIRLNLWEAGMAGGENRLREYLRSTLPDLSEADERAAEQWIERPIIWFLDGLDEIRDGHEHTQLRQEIAAMSASDQRKQDRWVITTRPSGFPEASLGAAWQVTRLCLLNDKQIEQVLEKWSAVLLKKELLELPYKRLAEKLRTNPGLQRIRGNGLMLTMAVLFYKTNRELPQDRCKFYEFADEMFLNTWNRLRLQNYEKIKPGKYLPELLEKLALEGMIEGVVSFSRSQLQALAEPLMHRHGYNGREFDEELARLLRAAEDLIGVLAARGRDRFGFLHLTFQEFYAARALIRKGEDARHEIARYWDHPDWAEVWSLYILGGADYAKHVEFFFSTVLASGHPLDEHLYRPELACLRWAGVGGDDPKLLEESESWGQVLESVIACLRKGGWEEGACLRTLRQWEKRWPQNVVTHYLEQIKDSESGVRRSTAATALARALGESRVQKALIAALEDNHLFVRGTAAAALAGAVSESAVRQALLAALKDEEALVRNPAAESLWGAVSEASVQQALLATLMDEGYPFRSAAVKALSGAVGELLVQQALVAALEDDDKDVRDAAATALSGAVGELPVQQAFLAALKDCDVDVRVAAVKALSSAADELPVREALLAALKDENFQVRGAAASGLWRVMGEPLVQQVLLAVLKDDDEAVRGAAVSSLSQAVGEPPVRQALLAALKDDHPRVRREVASVLSAAVRRSPVRQALLHTLKDPDWDVRCAGAEALSDAVSEAIVQQALLAALNDDEEFVRGAAVAALSGAVGEPAVRKALLAILEDDDEKVRCEAARALSDAASEPVVQQALLAALKDAKEQVRYAAADSLEKGLIEIRHPKKRA